MEFDFEKIVSNFGFKGRFLRVERFGCGHINDTFAAYFELPGGKNIRYILQRINSNLFKDVPRLMNNIKLVTEFNRKSVTSLILFISLGTSLNRLLFIFWSMYLIFLPPSNSK
jgi:hypothetical protein